MSNPSNQPDQLPSLADLFAESDLIGDKYLTADEIEVRDQEIDAANAAIDELSSDL